jgi:hypothetical protein
MTKDLILNNGEKATFLYFDDFKRKIYELENTMKVALVKGKLFTFDKEIGILEDKLKNEFQPQIIPENYNLIYDFHNEDILKDILKIESKENLLTGDVWVGIENKNFKDGLFIQIESKELNNGNYSDDIFSLYAYQNFLNSNNELETDYSKTIFSFEFNKSDIEKLENKNSIFKDFDTFKDRITQTYRNQIIEQDFLTLKQLELNNDLLVLSAGNGTYLFNTDDKDKFTLFSFTSQGSNIQELNYNEAKNISERHYHIGSFLEFTKNSNALNEIKDEMKNKSQAQELHQEQKTQNDTMLSYAIVRTLNDNLILKEQTKLKETDEVEIEIYGNNIQDINTQFKEHKKELKEYENNSNVRRNK